MYKKTNIEFFTSSGTGHINISPYESNTSKSLREQHVMESYMHIRIKKTYNDNANYYQHWLFSNDYCRCVLDTTQTYNYKTCCMYSSNLEIKSTILVQDQSYSQCSLQAHFMSNVKHEHKFSFNVCSSYIKCKSIISLTALSYLHNKFSICMTCAKVNRKFVIKL